MPSGTGAGSWPVSGAALPAARTRVRDPPQSDAVCAAVLCLSESGRLSIACRQAKAPEAFHDQLLQTADAPQELVTACMVQLTSDVGGVLRPSCSWSGAIWFAAVPHAPAPSPACGRASHHRDHPCDPDGFPHPAMGRHHCRVRPPGLAPAGDDGTFSRRPAYCTCHAGPRPGICL